MPQRSGPSCLGVSSRLGPVYDHVARTQTILLAVLPTHAQKRECDWQSARPVRNAILPHIPTLSSGAVHVSLRRGYHLATRMSRCGRTCHGVLGNSRCESDTHCPELPISGG